MIHFYDKNRNIVIKLYDFSFNEQEEPRIKFSSIISYSFYKASRKIEDYKSCLEAFLKELNLLYENKIEIALFVPLERQLEIYFKKLEFGQITVSIRLNNLDFDNTSHHLYESKLEINYEIDQSFLPELIDEISAVVLN